MSQNTRHRSLPAKRVSNRELRRTAIRQIELGQMAIESGARSGMILLTALAQAGGSITVTSNTIKDVGDKLTRLDYSVEDGVEPHTSVIKLVERELQPQAAPQESISNGDAQQAD